MLLIKMAAPLVADIKLPLNQWDKNSIRPGPVGSVGDALTSVRIKQSMPDMDFAYDKTFAPKNDVLRGSNVQDGQWFSFSDHGYNAQVKKRKLHKNNSFKTAVGWFKQDVSPPEKMVEPKLLPQGRVGWNTQEAAILQRSGDMFKDLPGGYKAPPGVLPRGNQYPRAVNLPIFDPFAKPQDLSKPIEKTVAIPSTNQVLENITANPSTARVLESVVNNMLTTPPTNIGTQRYDRNPLYRTVNRIENWVNSVPSMSEMVLD